MLGPYIAKNSLGGASAWAQVVTGEAVGALIGGIAGLRLRPRRTMVAIGLLFTVTALQNVLLAVHANPSAIAVGAALSGFAFAFGTVIWETALQAKIPRDRLSRVSAYNWFAAMAFLPAGYAVAGPVSDLIGMRSVLLIGAAWIVLTTLAVVNVRDVREMRLDEEEGPEAAVAAPV